MIPRNINYEMPEIQRGVNPNQAVEQEQLRKRAGLVPLDFAQDIFSLLDTPFSNIPTDISFPDPDPGQVNTITNEIFNNQLDKSIAVAGAQTATVVVGPVSNSDSRYYDYVTDGEADDFQIQAAINDLPTNGGRIILREGTYTIDSSITIAKNGVTIQGQGAGTIITPKTNLNADLFTLGDDSTTFNDCIIRDLKFDGNSVNQSSLGTAIANDQTNPIENLEITNCIFFDIDQIGVDYGNATLESQRISNCVFDTWGVEAIRIQSGFSRVFVENCYFTNSSTTQSYMDSGTNTSITNCYFKVPDSYNTTMIDVARIFANNLILVGDSPGASCVLVSTARVADSNFIDVGSTPNADSIAFSSCQAVTGNEINDIGIGADDCGVITGNFMSTSFNAVLMSGKDDALISGNSLSVTPASDNTGAVILISGTSVRHTITGNIIRGPESGNNPEYGVREDGVGDGPNVITGNSFRKIGTGGAISTQHTDTSVGHNIIN